jgi:hypothetical protein
VVHYEGSTGVATSRVLLGDVAMGRFDESRARVGELNGRKILVAGHDRCWPGLGVRADGWTGRYLTAGFTQPLS